MIISSNEIDVSMFDYEQTKINIEVQIKMALESWNKNDSHCKDFSLLKKILKCLKGDSMRSMILGSYHRLAVKVLSNATLLFLIIIIQEANQRGFLSGEYIDCL